ncbi:ABC transporter ATP-binding protein [Pseudoleptotrichia goodfellowii]|uniref:ABC transporter, ATP-binding protein n=2 Tax=Pseudoleptotrichia goodfellowii TaxID=157692 RepID=D0GNF3_9FUSO|nr:ABC transporter ATP-binding protein [Pseudoleptotrichia goodfellowii]EEY34363.1 ABC transporter, ATP-binding protein [Pseudoleptotrichia goodfellowii F0264]MBF4806123.1 ABC transporter ATP-binding protein [Pseudoleptotrichia goodfellowii]BBM35800.1 ABC transporter [Pseudoleptotrichia goodfellowii]
MNNLKFLLKLSGQHKIKLIFSALFSIISTTLSAVPYILIYNIILELFKEAVDYNKIQNLVFITIIFIIIRVVTFVLSGIFSHVSAFNILYKIRIDLIKHMSKLNMGFFKKNTSGKLKKIINEDVEKLENFIAHQIPDLSSAFATPLIFLGIMIYYNWKLSLVLFIPVILGIIAQTGMMKSFMSRVDHFYKLVAKLNSTIMEYINAMNVMKAFNLSAKSFKDYRDNTQEYADYWIELTELSVPYYSAFLCLVDGGLFFIIPAGGIMLLNHQISIPVYILFLLMSTIFLNSLKSLFELSEKFSFLLKGMEKIIEIFDEKEQISGNIEFPQNFSQSLKYENITFAYNKTKVINNFSLDIKVGSTVALVGPSGSGKTTIGLLAGRFWDISEGKITVDGIDIKDISYDSLMDKISFVFQDTFMLHDTIYENIKMGKNYNSEQIEDAAKKAQIHDFIMSLPDKYETKIGEGGVKLSGGEQQRISIARAILKDTPIVILDEVTSYSDIENETKIQAALKTLLKGKTALIIAHRLYTIKNADNIVFMNKGKIVEQGTHEELLKNKADYWHLWSLYNEETEGQKC